MTAQEDLTGMPTPKQDERTPGRQPIDNDLLDVMANAAWEKLGMVGMEEVRVAIELMLNAAWFEGYQLRSDAMVENTTRKLAESVNAYTSTYALREALHVAEQNFEAIRKVLINNLVEPERSAFWLAVRARDAARTALTGVTAPTSGGTD